MWLRDQSELLRTHLSFYFRQRDESMFDAETSSQQTESERSVFCGLGHSWIWKGCGCDAPNARLFEEINSFLSEQWPSMRCVGGTRSDIFPF